MIEAAGLVIYAAMAIAGGYLVWHKFLNPPPAVTEVRTLEHSWDASGQHKADCEYCRGLLESDRGFS